MTDNCALERHHRVPTAERFGNFWVHLEERKARVCRVTAIAASQTEDTTREAQNAPGSQHLRSVVWKKMLSRVSRLKYSRFGWRAKPEL